MDYEEIREDDGDGWGSVTGFDIKGHVDLDAVEMFLAGEATDTDEFVDGVAGGFDIKHVWRRKIPCGYGMRYQYQNHPGRGATAVTNLEPPRFWGKWCLKHPMEPASMGVPASSVIDGEQIVAEHLAALAEQIDPRPDVDASRGRYIYLCRPCSVSFHTREATARAEAWDTYKREHPERYPVVA